MISVIFVEVGYSQFMKFKDLDRCYKLVRLYFIYKVAQNGSQLIHVKGGL